MSEEQGEGIVVVDGSNVAYAVEGRGARLENIRVVCRKLQDEGFRPARVVSNERFRELATGFPEIVESAIRFMVVEGEVVLEKRAGRR